MDMDGDALEPFPKLPETATTTQLEPGSFQPDAQASNIMGRLPTPIQPSFAAQLRGNNWGGAAGNIMHSSPQPLMRPRSPLVHNAAVSDGARPGMGASHFSTDMSVPRTLDHMAMTEWNKVHNRSLPSPISESGGEEMGSPDMVLDNQFRPSSAMPMAGVPTRTSSSMSLPPYLNRDHHEHSVSPEAQHKTVQWPSGSSATSTLAEDTANSVSGSQSMDTDPPTTPSPARKGHTRSRHTVNNWTLHPGMKKSFSIGYRADCEKCRNKVPGHFNHIIVS